MPHAVVLAVPVEELVHADVGLDVKVRSAAASP
jgi:hypothetical protein